MNGYLNLWFGFV